MGLGNILFGRKKLKEASGDNLFALATAHVTLEVDLGLKHGGRAAVCFKPLSAGDFARARSELDELLDAVAPQAGSRIERHSDSYGFEWLIVHDADLEDLVTTVHLAVGELKSRGFGPQLLAAIFRFEDRGRPVYWIYGFKRGAFWPFVPAGQEQERDNARELELKAKLEKELPIEPDLTRWFAMFDAPL